MSVYLNIIHVDQEKTSLIHGENIVVLAKSKLPPWIWGFVEITYASLQKCRSANTTARIATT